MFFLHRMKVDDADVNQWDETGTKLELWEENYGERKRYEPMLVGVWKNIKW